ncbi:unnamed protein product [Boreogadus saida]
MEMPAQRNHTNEASRGAPCCAVEQQIAGTLAEHCNGVSIISLDKLAKLKQAFKPTTKVLQDLFSKVGPAVLLIMNRVSLWLCPDGWPSLTAASLLTSQPLIIVDIKKEV